uniref:Uncharacterized protein n=1 Tax=Panagrolaimus sp. ES5 TaxID=591445 RepID=A0AC34GIZ4_9BILA
TAPNSAEIYIENGVILSDSLVNRQAQPVALVFGTDGAIVNPSNPADIFNGDDQTTTDVNDGSFPKIISIGCSGCPVITPEAGSIKSTTEAPSTCIAAPNSAEIYIENGVVLSDSEFNRQAHPV